MEKLLKITSDCTRSAVLNEVSKALCDRAATKLTMGRSERLILEREADFMFRMASVWPGNFAALQQHVKSLLKEHETKWQALWDKVNMLFSNAMTASEKAHSRLP